MTMLVTLQQAKDHLRIDTSDDDNDLTLKIKAASNVVLQYLDNEGIIYEQEVDSSGDAVVDSNDDPVWETDSSGDYVVRYDVQAACLLMLGELYKSREGVFDGVDAGKLPPAVESLLSQLRDPVMS